MSSAIWSYDSDKNFPGYHFSGNPGEFAELVSKLGLYSKVSMHLVSPSDEMLSMANSRSKLLRSFVSLKLSKSQMTRVESSSGVLSIALSSDDLRALARAIKSYQDGVNDFSIKLNGDSLWFW